MTFNFVWRVLAGLVGGSGEHGDERVIDPVSVLSHRVGFSLGCRTACRDLSSTHCGGERRGSPARL